MQNILGKNLVKIDDRYWGENRLCCTETVNSCDLFQLVTPEWECKDGKTCTEDLCDMDRENWRWLNRDRTMVSYFELQCDSSYAILASSLFFVPGTVVGLAASG